MRRKAMLVIALIMMIMNVIVFFYLDQLLVQEISVYVIQVGRYDQQENADAIITRLQELNYEGYCYQDDNFVVITQIVKDHKEAQTIAKEISEQGITCVVKEYLVDKKYEADIDDKKYDNIYKELK